AERFAQIAQEAGADIFVVQSTVTTARHIATEYTPVDLRKLKKQLAIPLVIGNVVTYEACLELMDVGADALLIGVGPGAACTSRAAHGSVWASRARSSRSSSGRRSRKTAPSTWSGRSGPAWARSARATSASCSRPS